MRRRGVLIGLAATGIVCVLALAATTRVRASTTAVPAPSRVLFIGNSLTLTNDLPAMVVSLARAAGKDAVTETIAFGGFSLEDHWTQGDARRAIAKRGWSFVVLQQGPSSLPESQANLREFTKKFDGEIRAAGARTALYMVWPERARLDALDAVVRSYAAAAADVRGVLLPAGDAWRAAWRRDRSIALYGPDDFHPSMTGSYLAALAIVARLFDVSPIGLPMVVPPGLSTGYAPVSSATLRLLQDAAFEVTR